MAVSWKEAQVNEIAYWEKAFSAKDGLRTYTPLENVQFSVKNFLQHGLDFTAYRDAALLDLGCGPTGHVVGLGRINAGFFRVIYGVDPLMDQYVRFGTMYETDQIKLIASKVEDLALPLKFDVIISTNVVDHVDDPSRFTRKAAELLQPDGKFLVSVHCIGNLFLPVRGLMKYVDKNHPHHFTLPQFRDILREHFNHVELTCTASIVEDLPDHHWSHVVTKPGLRSLRRLVGNVILKSYYFTCHQ